MREGAFLTGKRGLDSDATQGNGEDVYLSFFGFTENPFSLVADRRFLFMGASHREALAELGGCRGLVVLSGEAGTGKTSLVLTLRERLHADTAVAHVFNTTLPFDGIVEFLLEELGVAKLEQSPARRLAALTGYLNERERAGQDTTLIIDEAQDLDVPTLEQVGMLANVDGGTAGKRLQILLVGSPELEGRLRHPDLQRLRDSVRLHCRIRALGADEVGGYIRNRLVAVGAPDTGLFGESAIARIAQYSGGVPRIINMLCDRCLIFAYADFKRRIDRHIAEYAIADLNDGGDASPRRFALRSSHVPGRARRILETVAIVLVGALVGAALSLLSGRG